MDQGIRVNATALEEPSRGFVTRWINLLAILEYYRLLTTVPLVLLPLTSLEPFPLSSATRNLFREPGTLDVFFAVLGFLDTAWNRRQGWA